ncbi:hypothetical protein BJ912DRAFT_119761 [Pholiota molesta]|nr:hypothetical protein BJ912DRAFT_119761 [Pholiota molesta]
MAHDFDGLPQEMYIEILSNLDAVSLIRCAMTSKSVYDAFKSSSLLVYTMQLHLDGLKDSGTSTMYPDLIESLLQRRQAWLSPERTKPLIHHTLPSCRAYELVGGAFANSDTTTESLKVIWAPTSNGDQGRTLQRPSVGFSVSNLTMDPTQDLMILLEDNGMVSPVTNTRIILIHIRTISTNAIHPLAQQSPLEFTALPHDTEGATLITTTLQIVHNTLGLYSLSVRDERRVLIWNWTTSELRLDSAISFDPFNLKFLRYDFGLLDSTYGFASCPSKFGSIRLYKFGRSHAAGASPATHLATLHLPPTTRGTMIHRISSYAGPIEAGPLPHAPFVIHNDDDRLHQFTVIYENRDARVLSLPLYLFLHQRVLVKYARLALERQKPLDVPWGEWGPPNTMFTRPRMESYEPNYIRHVHGQRCVYPGGIIGNEGPMWAPGSRYVEILDFSFAAVQTAKGMLSMPFPTPKGKPGTLVPSSIIRENDVPFFRADVETHLPCVITTLDLKQPYDAYMIHADGVIGVNINEIDHGFLLHMYTI